MADEAQLELGAGEQPEKGWRPSGRPAYRSGESDGEGQIVEQQPQLGRFGIIGQWLKRPFVRLIIGIGVFIFAAIVYDATVNYGEWTERAEKAKATNHRGLGPIKQNPDG